MKNVFITGGSGYSGKYLSEYLSKKKINVLSSFYKKKIFKKNYIKSNLLKEINLNIKCDWIVHTASHHKIKDFKNNPKLKLKNNIKMVKNLINFAKKKKIKCRKIIRSDTKRSCTILATRKQIANNVEKSI